MSRYRFVVYKNFERPVGLNTKDEFPPGRVIIATWVGPGSTEWIDARVEEGKAAFLGGDGSLGFDEYGKPFRYLTSGYVIFPVLLRAIRTRRYPFVSDDNAKPKPWNGEVKIDLELITTTSPDEMLLIDAHSKHVMPSKVHEL